MWSSWQWLLSTRSACGRRVAARPAAEPGSIKTLSSAPRTSSELPCGYLPPRAPKSTVTDPIRRSGRTSLTTRTTVPRFRRARSLRGRNMAPRPQPHTTPVRTRSARRLRPSCAPGAVSPICCTGARRGRVDQPRALRALFATAIAQGRALATRVAARALDRALPARAIRQSFVVATLRREAGRRRRGRDGLFRAAPDTGRESREESGAERRRLGLCARARPRGRGQSASACDECVAAREPAVDAQRAGRRAASASQTSAQRCAMPSIIARTTCSAASRA